MAQSSALAVFHFLKRPDLRCVAEETRAAIVAGRCASTFDISGNTPDRMRLVFPDRTLQAGPAWTIRHGLELSLLLEGLLTQETGQPSLPLLLRASFAAARTAALFEALDEGSGQGLPSPEGLLLMKGDEPPPSSVLMRIWKTLETHLPAGMKSATTPSLPLFEAVFSWLTKVWALIGPLEVLMASGGDARLQLDPRSGLNHYGCSHRPRPWAATFASSTASSVSERGFAAAERVRIQLQRALLYDCSHSTLLETARNVRNRLARYYGLPDGERVILAPSGTDCELAALAIAEMNPAHKPVTNILIAPEETGRGVPLAAAGCHFATDTAHSPHVPRGNCIEGFGSIAADAVEEVRLRNPDGSEVDEAILTEECRTHVERATRAGRHVLLHQLDLSKTGLLAPNETALEAFSKKFGQDCDIVVDACQARLMPSRIGGWVQAGRAVMVTGSKFFTGPPFCGALLLPEAWRSRLDHGVLPAGLKAYAGCGEWPECAATHNLSEAVNHGLILRWTAALAEMEALASVPPLETRWRLERFLSGVREAMAQCPDILLLDTPTPVRAVLPESWDDMTTILSFLVRAPDSNDTDAFIPLELEKTRLLYHWLNADLRPVFRPDEPERESVVAGLLCHIGQPVAMPSKALKGDMAGALRISAGARLVSGEPIHAELSTEVRLAREIADARLILAKISLICHHWERIARYDPLPTYAPATLSVPAPERSLSQQNGEK
ncbi:MAG: hypothetical protein ABF876_09055 [Acetobacter aceti]|uniref:Uncharacterized protein n=1 Tax=Acetobacter aceti TaxID=435 RepID=A0A1U9KIW7_ACEAC|nr:hypothetical protein [Acetobacter aceti]AQS85745.1 hypothetical protein A0U92_14280 [Acetobacter aceti]